MSELALMCGVYSTVLLTYEFGRRLVQLFTWKQIMRFCFKTLQRMNVVF